MKFEVVFRHPEGIRFHRHQKNDAGTDPWSGDGFEDTSPSKKRFGE